jgi:hypothetical protein
MQEFWDVLWKASIVFSLLNISLFGIVSKSYQAVKGRIDIQQKIVASRNRTSRLWQWVAFGFMFFYITYLVYASFIFLLVPTYSGVFLLDLIGPSLLVLPIALCGMLIGYTYIKWLLS